MRNPFNFGGISHVIKFPVGTFGFVGSVPAGLPRSFATVAAAVEALRAIDGAKLCDLPTCACAALLAPIKVEADTEYQTRIDADRVTLQFGARSNKRLDAGRKCIEDSPLFGGERQGGLF